MNEKINLQWKRKFSHKWLWNVDIKLFRFVLVCYPRTNKTIFSLSPFNDNYHGLNLTTWFWMKPKTVENKKSMVNIGFINGIQMKLKWRRKKHCFSFLTFDNFFTFSIQFKHHAWCLLEFFFRSLVHDLGFFQT